jgi:hypothetical protein
MRYLTEFGLLLSDPPSGGSELQEASLLTNSLGGACVIISESQTIDFDDLLGVVSGSFLRCTRTPLKIVVLPHLPEIGRR